MNPPRVPKGFRFGGARGGLKNNRKDVGVVVSDLPAVCAGVFTTNLVRAACVDFTRGAVEQGRVQAIVVNSGNANCCTGTQGMADVKQTAAWAAEIFQLSADQIAVASTGVIGHPLDMSKLKAGLDGATSEMSADPRPYLEAILTTDLVEKSAFAEVGKGFIYGVAKGSGMISPNMATMLGFVVTDLDVTGLALGEILKTAVAQSFNCLTVDGDTSTNDMILVLANGGSGVKPTAEELTTGLVNVCLSLTKQIARDGEGATKLVEVRVTGSTNPKQVARTIADSPLVKTAMFGCDPNWGRIMAAAGRSGVGFDPAKAVLHVKAAGESFLLFESGVPAKFDAGRVSTALKSDHVLIDLVLDLGGAATIYTCDFGYGYVRINAEYHT